MTVAERVLQALATAMLSGGGEELNANLSGVEARLITAGLTVTAGGVIATTVPMSGTVLPALSGDVSTAAGSSVTAIGAGKVTNTMLAGSIADSKLSANVMLLTAANVITGTNLTLSQAALPMLVLTKTNATAQSWSVACSSAGLFQVGDVTAGTFPLLIAQTTGVMSLIAPVNALITASLGTTGLATWRNTDAGVGSFLEIHLGNDALARAACLQMTSSAFTGAADRLSLLNHRNGGLELGTNSTTRVTVSAAGAVKLNAYTATTWVSGDKYLVVDATGNLHVSAIGPAS
jgi:hypothetical protein